MINIFLNYLSKKNKGRIIGNILISRLIHSCNSIEFTQSNYFLNFFF